MQKLGSATVYSYPVEVSGILASESLQVLEGDRICWIRYQNRENEPVNLAQKGEPANPDGLYRYINDKQRHYNTDYR